MIQADNCASNLSTRTLNYKFYLDVVNESHNFSMCKTSASSNVRANPHHNVHQLETYLSISKAKDESEEANDRNNSESWTIDTEDTSTVNIRHSNREQTEDWATILEQALRDFESLRNVLQEAA